MGRDVKRMMRHKETGRSERKEEKNCVEKRSEMRKTNIKLIYGY